MSYPIYRTAKVIDNLDPDELGRVKVMILPELNGVSEEDDLPWASPAVPSKTGKAEGVGINRVPDIDSFIRVRINNKYWTSVSYMEEAPLTEDKLYAAFAEEFNIPDLSAEPSYPQPNFEKTADGIIKFHDTVNGQIGIQHPSGLYVLIDGDGNLTVKAVKKVTIKNEDESAKFELDAESGALTMTVTETTIVTDSFTIGDGSDSAVLATPLEEILTELMGAMVVAPSGMSSTLMDSAMTPLTGKLTPKLQDMKSTKVTLD
jgi:hypothetical protein